MHMFYRVMKGIYQFASNLLSYIPTKYYWNRSTSDLVIAKSKRVTFFLKRSVVASGLYCKILTLYKIIKLIQCTTHAWLLLRFLSFLRLFLFVYKNTNSSDVLSHRECLRLGWYPQGPLYGRAQMRWGHLITFLGIIKIITLTVTGLSTRWPSQQLHFLNFLSPKWLCYKSSLTHPKCTKSQPQATSI